MKVIPLGPGFAAELRDVTLAEITTDDNAYREARAAFEQHSVLVFRDRDVSDESQVAFSRRFGPLEVTHVASQGAGTHLVILSTIGKDGKVVQLEVMSGHPLLVRAALDAVKQWLYKPTLLNGDAVEVDTTIIFAFSIGG